MGLTIKRRARMPKLKIKMEGLKSLAFGLLLGFSIAALALLLIYAVPAYIRPYFRAEAIPVKIHLFINSSAEMKGSIVKRKSAESTEIYKDSISNLLQLVVGRKSGGIS